MSESEQMVLAGSLNHKFESILRITMINSPTFSSKNTIASFVGLCSLALCQLTNAEPTVHDFSWNNAVIDIKNDWVRPTNSGQKVGAAYMTITSKVDCELTGVKSDVADTVEIHSMTMTDGIMKMRKMNTLTLKAEQAVKLAPGGFHLMLFGLKKPMLAGEKVDFSLQLTCGTQVLTPLSFTSTVKEIN